MKTLGRGHGLSVLKAVVCEDVSEISSSRWE